MVFDFNILAFLIAVIGSIVLGSLWYGPFFGEQWAKEMGFDMDEMKKNMDPKKKQEMMRSYMGMMISLIIQVLAFILLLSNLPINDLVDGVIWGVVLAVGVVWTETIGGVLWENHSWQLFSINALYRLLVSLFMTVIIVLFF